MTDRSLAILGGGAAGLGAAYALAGSPWQVTLFEARDRIGGRMATRRRNGCRYDTGANYVKDSDERTTRLLRELGTDGLVDVDAPVWTHSGDGTVSPSDRQEENKWSWRDGIEAFAVRVAERTDATFRLGTRVAGLDRTEEAWSVRGGDEERLATADAVLVTAPAPDTAELLGRVDWEDERLGRLRAAVDAVEYRTIRSVVLHYPFELDRPYYALVNPDRKHPVGWLSREECKPGHVPDGESLLVAQMSPDWSVEHWDDGPGDAAAHAARHAAALLDDERLESPDWSDVHDWRHALPDDAVDDAPVEAVGSAGLYFAGDWRVGTGRVARAFWNGHDVARRIDGE